MCYMLSLTNIRRQSSRSYSGNTEIKVFQVICFSPAVNPMVQFTVYKGSSQGKAVPSTVTKNDPVRDEVLIKNTHSGLCGTDTHWITQDMGLGHEGVGIVIAIGPEVVNLKVSVYAELE